MHYVFRCAANRWVFNANLKLSMLCVGSWRESGNGFQTIGAATENDRYPNLLRLCRGTTSWRQLADRRRWRLEMTDVRTQQSTKYWGARFWRHRKIMTPSLYWTRSLMSSQCSSEWSRSDKHKNMCLCKFLEASEDFAHSKSYLKFCRQILCSILFKHI